MLFSEAMSLMRDGTAARRWDWAKEHSIIKQNGLLLFRDQMCGSLLFKYWEANLTIEDRASDDWEILKNE